MVIEVIAERYGQSKKTLHEIILLILAKEFPLSAGAITKKIITEFNARPTFHAVRKSLLVMVDRKVLCRENNTFSINKNYVLEVKRLSDQLTKNYMNAEKQSKTIMGKVTTDDYATYIFENLIQLDKFWGEVVLDWARNIKENDDKRFCFQGPHCWYIFGHLGLEAEFLGELKSNNVEGYYLTTKNSHLDKWAKKFYDDYSIKYKTSNEENRIAIGVFGNFIMQFEYPEKIYSELEEVYSKSKDITKIRLSKIASILKKQIDIKLTITRNKLVAENLKNQICSKIK
ncbi:MAG: hypothetical protein ACP5NV_03645 [Candidatus Woesearchaeota archaeon]